MSTIDFAALANAAAASGPNMTQATEGGGGGEYVPPAEGTAMARLVGYIETGVQEFSGGAGQPPKLMPEAQLIFELSGANHAPKVLEDGTKLPIRMTEKLSAGKNYGALNEKANLYKLFTQLNYDGKATHMSQLVGRGFLVDIRHDKKGDKVYPSMRAAGGGYTFKAPRVSNPVDGTIMEISVPPPISALRLFVWNAAPEYLKQMWDSLFIDGSYPERKDKDGKVTAPAKSKNVLQERILNSSSFKGSPIDELLQASGTVMSLGAAGNVAPPAPTTGDGSAPAPTSTTSPSDPLAGLM